jgi:ABC-type lipoprotein export system ATPase subunit
MDKVMIIELNALEVIFNTGKESLKVLDIPQWSVKEGDRVAIWGPSGSGKSTLLNALAGLLPATNGSIAVCGHSLERMSEVQRDSFRASNVGIVFQNFNLLHGFTALENVLVGMTFSPRKPDIAEAEHLLGEVGLSHRLNYHPPQLSSGEQQRVAVARALANRPKLLLADEPTASLHPVNKEDVLRLLLDMCDRHGCTLVLVTHEREVISLFENTVTFLELNRAYHNQIRGIEI